jgi:hypothetical protein
LYKNEETLENLKTELRKVFRATLPKQNGPCSCNAVDDLQKDQTFWILAESVSALRSSR